MRITPPMRVRRSRLRAFSLIEVSVALSMGIVLIGSLIWLSSTFGQMINGTVSDTLFTTELPQAASVIKTIIHNSLQLRIYTSLATAEADTTGTNAVNFQTAGTGDVIRILLVNSDGSRSWAIIDCSNPGSWNYFLDHNSALPAVGIPAGSQLSSEMPSWGATPDWTIMTIPASQAASTTTTISCPSAVNPDGSLAVNFNYMARFQITGTNNSYLTFGACCR